MQRGTQQYADIVAFVFQARYRVCTNAFAKWRSNHKTEILPYVFILILISIPFRSDPYILSKPDGICVLKTKCGCEIGDGDYLGVSIVIYAFFR